MTFIAFDVSLEMIRRLRTLLDLIQTRDGSLANQLRRAAASVPLNLSEGRRRRGKDRLHFYRIAAGSADETRACLLVADAWGYIKPGDADEVLGFLDRICGMTWRLTH